MCETDEVNRVVSDHLGLAMDLAKRFSGRADVADLFQAGCIGLINAARRYDPGRGVAFTTFAVPHILGEIRAYLRGQGPAHVPRPMHDLAHRCVTALDQLRQEMQREPAVADIAVRVGVDPADVVLAMESYTPALSLQAPLSCDEDGEIMDMLCDDPQASADFIDSLTLKQALASLPERERTILFMRFFTGRTQAETAHFLGISQPQVHRLERSGLLRLRKGLGYRP